jgi:hypothetical protein
MAIIYSDDSTTRLRLVLEFSSSWIIIILENSRYIFYCFHSFSKVMVLCNFSSKASHKMEMIKALNTLKTSFLLALFLFESNHPLIVFQSSERISSNEACLENVE